jgi:hypothetical protein
MKARYPRTAGEFLEHDRTVVLRCHCGRGVPPVALRAESVVQRFGGEFDLYGGFGELRRAFPCEACERPTDITFHDFNAEHFRTLSAEESLVASLEHNAFVTARDADAAGLTQEEYLRRQRERTLGRWRRFGRSRRG